MIQYYILCNVCNIGDTVYSVEEKCSYDAVPKEGDTVYSAGWGQGGGGGQWLWPGAEHPSSSPLAGEGTSW